jgi:hypothetical protein
MINTTYITRISHVAQNYSLAKVGSLKLFHSSSYLLSNSNINTENLIDTNPAIVEQKLNTIKSYNELLQEKEYKN